MLRENGFRLNGKPLKMLRITLGYKQIDIAKELNITKAYVSMCERGVRSLSVGKTRRFLELIGISEEEAKAFVEVVGK